MLETWRPLFRSIAVPTVLIACPVVLAKYWHAWRHFLQPLDALTQCLLLTTPVLLTEALVISVLALVLHFLIRRGVVEKTATGACADVLTLMILGYCGFRLLDNSPWSAWLHPTLLSGVVIAALIVMRLRSDNSFVRFEQHNRSSEAILLVFFAALAILSPGRVTWRRFDPLPTGHPAPRTSREKPDVVLITFDALSAQDMSLLHYHLPTTPNFEKLAKTSHVFSHFYSSSDFTTPAVASLITGKDLFSHRVYQLTGMLPAPLRDQNLAHLLAANGYRTAAVVTNSFAHPLHLGIDRSFDYLPEPPTNPWLRPLNWPLQIGHSLLFDTDASSTAWVVPFLRVTGKYFPSFDQNPSVDPGEVFAVSERLIDSTKGPLFIWIHLFTPHFPYVTRPQFRGRFLPGDRYTTQTGFDDTRLIGHYREKLQPVFDQLRARYDESIADCDAALGSFLNWLDARGRRAHTLLVVSADHGEAFHQWWGHASPFLLYPEVHIPLLISLPGQKTGAWHNQDASLPDVAPTILALLGLTPPAWMNGRALLASSATDPSHQPAFAAYLALSYTFGHPQIGAVAAFSGDYQLVWYFPQGIRRLFDVSRDPEGILDVISDHPDVATALTRAIALRLAPRFPL